MVELKREMAVANLVVRFGRRKRVKLYTGAGDAFSGSLAVFWAAGSGLRDSARRAAAAAALAVTRLGAQAAFPSRGEVETFLAGQAKSS